MQITITKRAVEILISHHLGDINKAVIQFAKVHHIPTTRVRAAFKKVLDGAERVTV